MPIRFSKSGFSLRIGATTLVATASLWFGSAVYAQTQQNAAMHSAGPSSQTLQRIFDERDYRFSQLPALDGQAGSSRLRPQRSISERLPSSVSLNTGISERPQPVVAPSNLTPSKTKNTEQLDVGNKTTKSVDSLFINPVVGSFETKPESSEARVVVTDKIQPVPAQTVDIVARLTASPSLKPTVSTASHVEPTTAKASNVYQLKAISMNQFEQKLLDRFGSQLKVTTSGDGRFVRVSMPARTIQNAVGEPMAMLVDRKTGKLQYEGDGASTDQWRQLMSQIDSIKTEISASAKPAAKQTVGKQPAVNKPAAISTVASTELQAEIVPLPKIQTVAFQQDDQANQGTPVQGIAGLKGQVFIARDPNGGGLTITGDPDDVAIVKREIARLSAQAKSAQPSPASIPLENARGNLIQARVQEIYDTSYAPINGPANITATDSPNSLVVVGSPEAVEAIRNLVQLLDVKQEEGSVKDFRTFGLKYLSANDAANRLRRFFGTVTAANGDIRIPESPVEVIPDFRSNQVTVKGSQTILSAAADFLKTIDVATVDDGAVNEVRVIRLKNALATDVAFVIQNAINGQQPNAGEAFASQTTGQAGQQQSQAQVIEDNAGNQSQLRSAMLSFMTRNAQGQLIKSGIMFDVRITADSNSNSLIVTGPATSIPLIVELVKQLDRIPDAESQIKVFELVYSDAQTIFDMLDSLFNSQNQNQGVGNQQTGGTSNLPLQTGGGSDGASLINLRFSIEPRSNAIIASGPARDLQVIEDLLNRLDARAVNNFPAQVYRLSNAPAQDVADAINSYLEGRTDLIDSDPRTATGVPAVSRAIIVTPEVVSNSLIVSALPEYLGEIENIIRSLDRRPPMIQVKVLIAEVNLDAVEEFGVELGIQDSLLFDRGTSVAAGGALTGIGFPFNTGTVGNANAFARESLAGQALSNLNVGRVNSALGYGGLVLSAGNESISILLRALKDRQCVRVLSKPQIMTMENLQGRVAIGASVARIAGSTQTNFGLTQDIEFRDVGVILEVTPRVSPDGLIVLTVNAENSSVGPEATGTAVGVSADGSIIRAQQILKTEAQTTLSARSGQTVVFSGLITENKTHTERGAPIISDLPVIGPLFKFESDSSSRSELLIIMTPTLVTDDSDLTSLNNEAMDRMHWCLSDVAEVYGSTGYGAEIDMGQSVDTFYPDADPTGTMQPLIHNSKLETPDQPVLGGTSEVISEPVVQSMIEPTPVQAVAKPAAKTVRSARKTRWNPFSRR